MPARHTTISVSHEVADALYALKKRGETWDEFFVTRHDLDLDLDDQQTQSQTSNV
jgi:hypothetical protein